MSMCKRLALAVPLALAAGVALAADGPGLGQKINEADVALWDISIGPDSPAAGRRIGDVRWPDGAIVVAVTDQGEMMAPHPGVRLHAGERVVVLSPASTRR